MPVNAGWQGRALTVRVLFSQAGVATQILVACAGQRALFDAGDGTLRDLLANGVDPESLTHLLLTHGHADHVGGLYALLGYLRAQGHTRGLSVWAPRGSHEAGELVAAFRRCHRHSLPYPPPRGVPGGRR
ncbi:MAG: MBL fold metallo-hydrolase [Candidatus Bipolaricaulaceae bacterium]